MSDKVFVDSNVLVYAHDADAGRKHLVAKSLLQELWRDRRGVLSHQVLQEFYVNVTRKIPKPLPARSARDVVAAYGEWVSSPVDVTQILRASEIEERHRLSFWDALIVSAALHAGAARIVSEDFQPGRRYEGVRVDNPFGSAGSGEVTR
jgi:predicted nucleic acid-binding protein